MRAATALLVTFLFGCGGASPAPAATPAATLDPRVHEDVAAEAIALLGVIREREQAFLLEYGTYSSSGRRASGAQHDPDPPWAPVVMPIDGVAVPWATETPGWNELEFWPGDEVRVQLRIAAGPPGTEPVGGGPADDFWFVAMARARLGTETHTWIARSWAPEIEARVDP